jgi:hypothetical protein
MLGDLASRWPSPGTMGTEEATPSWCTLWWCRQPHLSCLEVNVGRHSISLYLLVVSLTTFILSRGERGKALHLDHVVSGGPVGLEHD